MSELSTPADQTEPVEPEQHRRARRSHLRYLAAVMMVAATTVACVEPSPVKSPPDGIFFGSTGRKVKRVEKTFPLEGAVNLSCHENGKKPATVTASIREVTIRDDGTYGHVVNVVDTPGQSSCNAAIEVIKGDLSVVYNQARWIADSAIAVFTGDGTLQQGQEYEAVIQRAARDGHTAFFIA